jgi:hypothetical protein
MWEIVALIVQEYKVSVQAVLDDDDPVNKRNNVTFPANTGPIQLEGIVQNPVVQCHCFKSRRFFSKLASAC